MSKVPLHPLNKATGSTKGADLCRHPREREIEREREREREKESEKEIDT